MDVLIADAEMAGLGFALVLGVLSLLWGATAAVGAIFMRHAARAEAKAAHPAPAAVAPPQPAPQTPVGGPPPHHIAAIAAVIEAMGYGEHRVHIRLPGHERAGWLAQGRVMQNSRAQERGGWGRRPPPPPTQTPPTHKQ
ncbi:OadG family transporter subunit [Roseospirillum parvum]|uniref:Oxaloacetate decarboxylase, gamma chain n=1 Tax=Roseospirillum parvum TaxID=83401 RepID=A0A1G7WVX3_9PROT|nr:OadG family transporter subunit [Roseospirillum parvum]SDG76054.1 Oxaloacetate decarboxylase, gamma chain [Roseospirillum parvum]